MFLLFLLQCVFPESHEMKQSNNYFRMINTTLLWKHKQNFWITYVSCAATSNRVKSVLTLALWALLPPVVSEVLTNSGYS